MENITELVNKIYLKRHKLKMLWFSINKQQQQELMSARSGSGNEETKDEDEELTEETRAKNAMDEKNKIKWRELAR